MKPRDPSDVLLVCPIPLTLLDEIDSVAGESGRDRATLVRELLGEALRVRTLARVIDDETTTDATIIPFPRPPWAVELDGEAG